MTYELYNNWGNLGENSFFFLYCYQAAVMYSTPRYTYPQRLDPGSGHFVCKRHFLTTGS